MNPKLKPFLIGTVLLGAVLLAWVYWPAGRSRPIHQAPFALSPASNQAQAASNLAASVRRLPAGYPFEDSNRPPPATARATDPFAGITKAELLERLKNWRGVPPSTLAGKFTVADESALLGAYRAARSLPERSGAVWVLAGVGGDETARAFIHTLTEEFSGKKLVADEGGSMNNEEAMLETITGLLGQIASRSGVAREFLMQATDPAFWQRHAKWTSSTGAQICGLLAADAIGSVGMMERPDTRSIIDRFKQNPPVDRTVPEPWRYTFEGAIVQAAFYADLVREKGSDGFYRWFLDSPRDIFDADGSYRRWKASPEGIEWKKWYDESVKDSP